MKYKKNLYYFGAFVIKDGLLQCEMHKSPAKFSIFSKNTRMQQNASVYLIIQRSPNSSSNSALESLNRSAAVLAKYLL